MCALRATTHPSLKSHTKGVTERWGRSRRQANRQQSPSMTPPSGLCGTADWVRQHAEDLGERLFRPEVDDERGAKRCHGWSAADGFHTAVVPASPRNQVDRAAFGGLSTVPCVGGIRGADAGARHPTLSLSVRPLCGSCSSEHDLTRRRRSTDARSGQPGLRDAPHCSWSPDSPSCSQARSAATSSSLTSRPVREAPSSTLPSRASPILRLLGT